MNIVEASPNTGFMYLDPKVQAVAVISRHVNQRVTVTNAYFHFQRLEAARQCW